MRLVAAALAAALCFGAEAVADERSCATPVVAVVGERALVVYDPFENQDAGVSIPLQIEEASGDVCRTREVVIEIAPGEDVAATPGRSFAFANGLRFSLLDSRNRPVHGQGRVAVPLASGQGAGALGPDLLRVEVRRGQPVAPGDYEGRLTLRTLTRDGAPAERTFDLIVRVEPSVRLGAVETRVDFGEMSGGETERLSLAAFANTGFLLDVTSENGWAMMPEGGFGDEGVPYDVTVGGRSVSAGGGGLAFDAPRSGFAPLELDFEVGAFGDLPAGVYRDWVQVRIQPRVS